MFLVGLLRYFAAYIGQAEEEILIHGEEATRLQGSYRMAHAGLRHLHIPGHIHRAYHAFLFLEYQHSLQIVLAGSVQFFIRKH